MYDKDGTHPCFNGGRVKFLEIHVSKPTVRAPTGTFKTKQNKKKKRTRRFVPSPTHPRKKNVATLVL